MDEQLESIRMLAELRARFDLTNAQVQVAAPKQFPRSKNGAWNTDDVFKALQIMRYEHENCTVKNARNKNKRNREPPSEPATKLKMIGDTEEAEENEKAADNEMFKRILRMIEASIHTEDENLHDWKHSRKYEDCLNDVESRARQLLSEAKDIPWSLSIMRDII
ncbi:hypothetical protein FQN54_007276 [Arachnomyces sp. PD_36]|nr:hypothetical protein FQN54_007276 [Arachnomyces sp. PD_36]